MRYEDSMKGVADQIIKEQQRVSKIKNNPEEFHWHDEYATLNFFRFICKNIGNLIVCQERRYDRHFLQCEKGL